MVLGASLVAGLIGLVLAVGLYFLPSLVADHRKVPNVGSIFVINLLLGWTVVGWVIALAMAARTVPSSSTSVSRPTPSASEPQSASSADEIEHLAALHARGVLTDEEFRAAKARVLGSPGPPSSSTSA